MADFKFDPKTTVVPLTSAVGLAWAFIQMYMWFSVQVTRIDTNEREIRALKMRIESNRWQCSDQELYMEKLGKFNPGLVVPGIPRICNP